MQDHFIYNNTVIIVLGVALLLGAGVWLWLLSKKNPGLDLGELIATMAVDKNETIFVICVFGIFMAEAFVAATVHAPNEPPPNPLARILSHTLISVIGTVASVTAVRDLATMFMPNIPVGERVLKIMMATFVTALAVTIPYFNLILIASGLGQYSEYDLWTYSLYASPTNWAMTLKAFNLPENYQAFAQLQTILKTSIIMTGCHYALNILEGFRNIVSKRRREMLFERIYEELKADAKKGKGTNVNNNPMPGEQRQYQEVPKNARFLLSRLNYARDKLDKMVDEVEKAIDRIKDDSVRMKMAARMGALVTEAKTIDSSSGGNKATKKAELVDKIYDFFQGPIKGSDGKELPPDKRGLNLSIKGGSKK